MIHNWNEADFTERIVTSLLFHRNKGNIGEMSVLAIEDMAFSNRTFLFSNQQNYAHIVADENGLWIIYSSTRSNNTMLLKASMLHLVLIIILLMMIFI